MGQLCTSAHSKPLNPYKTTSQVCSSCGMEGQHKDLSIRTHICVHCGIVLDRDHNAALNVLRLGRSPQLHDVCAWQGPTVEAPAIFAWSTSRIARCSTTKKVPHQER